MWKHKEHVIYDAFPDGDLIEAESIALDFTVPIKVVASKQAMCWRKLKSKSKKWVVQLYVAVQFEHKDPDGNTRKYCTTFSRDVDQWMFTWEEYEAFLANPYYKEN